jgi:hypothetical protein
MRKLLLVFLAVTLVTSGALGWSIYDYRRHMAEWRAGDEEAIEHTRAELRRAVAALHRVNAAGRLTPWDDDLVDEALRDARTAMAGLRGTCAGLKKEQRDLRPRIEAELQALADESVPVVLRALASNHVHAKYWQEGVLDILKFGKEG